MRLGQFVILFSLAQYVFCQTGHGSLTGGGNEKQHTHNSVLISITVTPASASVTVGSSSGFVATANFSDNTTLDVTTSAAWLSLSPGVASVGSSADPWPMSCVGVGSASIVATYNGFSSQGTLTCTPQGPPSLVSIALTPVNPSILDGQSIGFTATGTYSDGSHQNITSQVNWTSGTPSVATVGPLTATESGNCLTTGSSTITATDPATGINGSTTLTCTPPVTLVIIDVTPANSTANVGFAQNFTATGTYSDGSTQNLTAHAGWSSSNTGVVTMGPLTTTEAGNCIAVGTVTVTATFSSVSGHTNLTCQQQNVGNWSQVSTPATFTQITYFNVKASTNEWYVADRVQGFAKSTNQGSSWTTINTGIPIGGLIGGWTIQANPHDGSLVASTVYRGASGVIGFYRSTNDGASWTQMSITGWHNANGGAYTGCILPLASGGTNLVCGGFFGSLNTSEFYSSNDGVTNTLGAYSPGNSSVYALVRNPVDGSYWGGTENNGTYRSTDGGATFNQIWPDQASPNNANQDFLTFDTSGNVLVSCIAGLYRGVGSGSGPYTWTRVIANGNTSAGLGLVTDSLGNIYWGHGMDNTNPTTIFRSTDSGVTWSAWDTGLPQGLEGHHMEQNPNDNNIYAVIENGSTNAGSVYRRPISGSFTPSLVSIALNPQNPTAFDGSSDNFTAICTYSDNSTRNCTSSDPLTNTPTVWASATPSVASLGGLTTVQTVNCLTTGASLISATISAVSGSTTQTCASSTVTLVSIGVTPTNPTQYNGSTVAFTATGTYSDGSQRNLTSSATWTSATPAVATISANIATCVANSGTSVITATFSAISGNTTLTCAPVPPSPTGENAGCAIGDVASAPFNTSEITTVLGVTVTESYPHTCLYTATNGTPAPGSLVSKSCPASQAAFQSDLNGLTTGETLQYPNGCSITVTSPVTFPAVAGADINHWNWFESTGGAGFPAEHTRASPCILGLATMAYYPNYTCGSPADLTVHIVCATGGDCLNYASGAAFWRNIGIDVHLGSTTTNDGNGLVDLSGADHIIWDRYLAHGNALACTLVGKAYSCQSTDLKNAFFVENATNIGVINGWGYDILCPQGSCTDAHVFGGGSGTGAAHNFKIYGNLLAGAGEDWLSGGAGAIGSSIVTPTDWDIRNNHFFRPVSWVLRGDGTGQHPEIKNHFEIKNGARLWFAGNVIENNWMGWQTDQQGYGMVIGPRNQSNTITVKGVSSDGAGHLTATTGAFGTGSTSPVNALCANSGHCEVKISGAVYLTQTQTDATHISVSPSPAAGTFANVTQCTAGLNPNATGTDYIIEYNDFRNLTNGVEIASVASDCGDPSLQNTRGSVQNNLFQGIDALNNSGLGANAITRCSPVLNTQTGVTITNIVRNHNTCIISNGLPFGNSGVDVTYDSTAHTTDGSSGSYLANMITANNIGPAGGVFTYKQGGLYPGGAAAGLKQMSCTPPVTGTTCTYSYAANVLGQNLWTHQLFNAPFPSTNQTCNGAGATCFPSGSAFTSLFTQYNSGSGQPGYLGDYHLAGSTYKLAGTDGLDIGANITQVLSMTSGVWSPTNYTAASITQASPLPNATHAVPYSLCLTATSASDFQYWTVTTGSLPAGLSLSLAGCITGTPSTAGSNNFGLTMMDAAQQYATKTFSLTVN